MSDEKRGQSGREDLPRDLPSSRFSLGPKAGGARRTSCSQKELGIRLTLAEFPSAHWLLPALLIVVSLSSASLADSPGSKPSNVRAGPSSHSEEAPADREQRRRVVTVAVLLLMGVAAVGGALVALVIWWGLRLRRLTRSHRPQPTNYDELWYLRTNRAEPIGEPTSSSDTSSGDDPAST